MAGLHFDITGDNSNFLRKLDEARNGVRSTSKQIEESGMSIEQMFGRLTNGVVAFGASITAKEIVSNIVRVRGEFQQLEVAFNTMLGSEQKATSLMHQLVKTAATTPFDLQSVANGAKQLLAYGTSAEDVNGTLVQLGDIAAGLSIPLNDLVYLYGTTMTQGRLFTADLRQFQGRGIPLDNELAKQFGVTKDKVGELVTAGKIGFPEVQKAIVAMTSEGGKFGGLMEAQSKTITGQISNIEDSISTMYNNIGKQSEGFINDALSDVSYLVENYEKVGKTIIEVAATYGAYKAVLISVAAYQSFAVDVTYSTEIAELSKLIPLKQQSANQDVLAAVTSGKLTQSKAEQVIALRTEISAKIQSMQATEAQTKVEYASAMASYKAATQRMLLAKQNMAMAQSQMSIAIKSGTVEEIAAAKKNAQTASLELNNAAVAKNTAHKGVNIAATNSKSASEALNTVQTGLNTVSQNKNTVSTNILTAAKTKLASASKALGLSMLTNPYVLAAAAVAGLGYTIYKTVTAETELDKAHKRLNDATSDVEKVLTSEVSKLTSLERKLAETKKGTEEYNAIKKTIVDNYGQYYKGLDGEIERVGNLSTVYGQLVEAMRLSIGQRKFESFFKAEQDNLDKTIGEKLDTAYETLIDKYGKTKGGNLYNQFFDSAMRGEALSPSTIKDLQNATFMDVKWGSNAKDGIIDFRNSVFDLRHEISKEMKATEEVLDEYKSKFRIAEEDFAKMLSGDSTSTNEQPKDNKTLKQLLLDIDASKSEIKELQEQANKGLISSDKIKEEQDVLSKLTSDYKNRTGIEYGSTKSDSASEKLRKEQEELAALKLSQSQERQRTEKDLVIEEVQGRINAMAEGSEKVLAQMKLDHEKEIETLKRRREDYLNRKIEWEKALFQKDPSNKKRTFDSSKISLTEDEETMFGGELKSILSKQGNEISKYYKNLLSKYQGYIEKYTSTQKMFAKERKELEDAGASKETLVEHDYQRDETLKAVNNEFAMREDSFKAWADGIADLSLNKLRELLFQAEQELQRSEFLNPNDPKLAQQRAKVAKLKEVVIQKAGKTDTSPDKRSQKEWQDLYSTLEKVNKQFEEIGSTVGGVAGEIISTAGDIASSTLQMVSGITTLANSSSQAMSGTAQAASQSVQAVEKASVILAVIGAALQIATKLASLFSRDNKLQKSIENSERSVKKLTWAFEDLERAREKAEGDGKDLYTDKMVENLKKQQEELKKQQQAERQKKKADQEKISDLGREYEKLGQQIEDIKEDAFNEKLQENIEKSERAVKKLEWAFNDLKRAMDKTLGEAKYDYVPKLLENIRKKQEEILRQIDEENRKTNPDQGKLDELRRSYEEFNQQIEDLIEDLKNDFIGGTAQDIAQRLGDAFIEAFAKGEDAAKTWQKSVKEIIGDIVKRMLITKLFEVPIGNILDEFWEKYSGKSTTDNDSGKDDPNNNDDKNNPSSRPSGSGSNNSGRVQSDHPRESGDRPSSDNIGNKNDRPSGNNPSYAPAAPGNKNKEEGQKEFKFIPIVTGCPGPTAPVKPNPVIPMKPGQVTPGNKAEVDKGTDQSDAIKWLNDALMGFGDGLEDSMKPFMDILNKFLGEGSIEDGVSGQLQSAMTEGTGSQLVGLWNMTALDIREMKNITSEGFKQFKPCFADVHSMVEQTRQIQLNTLRSANNTNGLMSEMKLIRDELGQITKNTKTYKGRG